MSANHPKPSVKPGADDAGSPPAPDDNTGGNTTGRVKFDERGNAIWEWSVATGAFGREVSTERLQKLEHPALSIADDAPTPVDTVRPNPLGTKKGYDPYDSGKLGKRPAPAKKDLRKLSEFLKLKKQAAGNNPDEE
ncbi:MAG: hypothetical protein ACYDBZ_02085 [Steroidobacteraceae bacterium]